jgi:beta-glucosidase
LYTIERMSNLFPARFAWGVATAAYQIEGANRSDGRGPCVWDMMCRAPGRINAGHVADVACDHYHRFAEDIALMKRLGVTDYRMSVSWTRIMPDGSGAVNEAGLAYYDRLVDALLAAGIRPWITLFHWDYPHALFCRGGWLNRESINWFADYATVVARRLGDRVQHWITHNEPQMFLALGHVAGSHAPGLKLADAEMLRVCHHAFCAHGAAVRAVRAACPRPVQIGFAPAGFVKIPRSADPADLELARQAMFAVTNRGHFNNAWYMDPMLLGTYPADGWELFADARPPVQDGDMALMSPQLDFLGINIYGGCRVKPRPAAGGDWPEIQERPGERMTMMNWHAVPESLYWGPRLLHERYKLPIVITENGMSGHDWIGEDGRVRDAHRIEFTRDYLRQLARAVADGVDVRGYFHWSLMDNFEWAEGYKQRFGLVHVDYQTLKRTPKDSFAWYAKVIASQGRHLDQHGQGG